MKDKKTIQSIELNIEEINNNNSKPYTLEEHVNDWVKKQFSELNLKNQQDFYTESAIPDYLKEALKGRAKTEKKPISENLILV